MQETWNLCDLLWQLFLLPSTKFEKVSVCLHGGGDGGRYCHMHHWISHMVGSNPLDLAYPVPLPPLPSTWIWDALPTPHWTSDLETCSNLKPLPPCCHWYWHLVVATEAGSTHPTGVLSCVMLPRHTSTRNTGHKTIPVLVFVTHRCCSYRRKLTSMCTRTMFWASYRRMVSGRSTDGQGQSKVLIPPENTVCGEVMFSVVSVYQFVLEGGPYTRPQPKHPLPSF